MFVLIGYVLIGFLSWGIAVGVNNILPANRKIVPTRVPAIAIGVLMVIHILAIVGLIATGRLTDYKALGAMIFYIIFGGGIPLVVAIVIAVRTGPKHDKGVER